MDEYYGSYPVGPSRKQVILRLAIAVAALLIVGVVIVWLIFFHHKSPDIISKVGKVETSQQTKKSGNTAGTKPSEGKAQPPSGSSTGQTGSASSEAKTNSSKSATNSAASPTATDADQSSSLSQTGPGSVLGLFAATVVLAGALRRWQLSHR